MKKRKTMIIDFDSTIANTSKAIFEIYKEETKDNSLEYHTNFLWNFEGLLPLDYTKNIYGLFDKQELFDKLEFLPNAKEVLYKLNNDFNLIICTVHNGDSIHLKHKWIKENLPFINNICYLAYNGTHDKSIINGEIIIDDRPSCLTGDRELKICFGDYGYNKKIEDNSIIKINNWNKVYDVINKKYLK